MIRANDLTKLYGINRAVDRVSFHVHRGEIVGLLGPNGSGKTTIMRMLTGFFAPTSGTCSIAGVDVTEDPIEARRRIGYLPERVALYPDMQVRTYLRFVARVHGITGRLGNWVDDAMERCGLTHMSKRYIGKLSRGYRQRVGIAQAIIHRPEVLILDEPTVGLDPRQIVEIRALIRELGANTTILLSTHILPEVSITCGRVLILDKGRLVAEDTAEGLAAKATGSDETCVRLEGPADRIEAALSECEGVIGVEYTGTGANGTVDFVVRAAPGVHVAPAIARMAAYRNWPLHEVTARHISLEDLFVRILERAEQGKGGTRA